MALRWLLDDVDVEEGVFVPGKLLTLEATGMTVAVAEFEMFQLYSSAMRQILKHVGVPERRVLQSRPVVDAGQGTYRTDRQWMLPPPRGPRKSSAFIFAAKEKVSGRIYSSRFGKAEIEIPVVARAGVQDPTGTVQIGVEGRAQLTTTIYVAVDPEIEVRVLTGEDLVQHMLDALDNDVVREEDEDRDVAARIETARRDVIDTLRAAYTGPADWLIGLPTTHLSLDTLEAANVTVDIEAPSEGTGYFALSFLDRDDNSGELAETTDAVAITVDAAGNVTVIPYVENLPLPQLATFG